MKPFFRVLAIIALTAFFFSSYAPAEESNAAPPIAQPLVREGEFARQLAEALKIMPAQTETEAENMLTAAGIVPLKGWIADYPVTPDILNELEKAVQNAARTGTIALDEEEALQAFLGLKRDAGLEGVNSSAETYAENEPPSSYDADSPMAADIDRYYESEGPPVVTYYPPPYPYYERYGWVPYPFWCSGVFFSGFFILRDFHRPIFVHKKAFVVSNHFFDHRRQKNITVTPHKRFFGDIASYREKGLRGSWGGEGNRPWGINRGNSASGPGRMERGRGEQGLRRTDFKSRTGGKNQGHPLFNGRSGLSRDKLSVPERTTGNRGGTIRTGGEFNPRTNGGGRTQRSFGSERRALGSMGRGSGGFSSSISRQDRGIVPSPSGSRGRFFEGRGSPNWGFSGGGSSFKGFNGSRGRR